MSSTERWRKPLPVSGIQLSLYLQSFAAIAGLLIAETSIADGTPAGTVIDNVAQVEFDVNGSRISIDSNTASVTVDERIDVVVTALTPEVVVASSEAARPLLFSITNTGNGNEAFSISFNNAVAGDDFDPVPAASPIYFDSDGSGDLTVADQPYVVGSNDPVLGPDESVTLLLVNDIPAVAEGSRGRSEFRVVAVTGSGTPGTPFGGAGDGGVSALIGASGGAASQSAEYLVASVSINVNKSVVVLDPFGGTSPIPGATLTYTVAIEVTDDGTATNGVFIDPIPDNTTFIPASISLNGSSLTDAADTDAGQFSSSANPEVRVVLGDLTQANGVQTVSFQVTID